MGFLPDYRLELPMRELPSAKGREFLASDFMAGETVDGKLRGFLCLNEFSDGGEKLHIYEVSDHETLKAVKGAGQTTKARLAAFEKTVLNDLGNGFLDDTRLIAAPKGFDDAVATTLQRPPPAAEQAVSASIKGGQLIGKVDFGR